MMIEESNYEFWEFYFSFYQRNILGIVVFRVNTRFVSINLDVWGFKSRHQLFLLKRTTIDVRRKEEDGNENKNPR